MSTEWTRSAAGEGRAAMMRKGPTLCLDLRLHQDGEPPSPPQIYPQQQVTAPSLGVESMGHVVILGLIFEALPDCFPE